MATPKEEPIWTTYNGQKIPYDKVIIRKGESVYTGGGQPKRSPRDIRFPDQLDRGERGFGVDEDIFVS